MTYHTMLHEQIQFLFRGFRRDAHPMAVMIGVVGALSAFYYEDLEDRRSSIHREIATYRLIAKIPTIAAMCHKYSIGQPFVYPRNDLSYAENFLHMMFAVPCEPYKVNPVLAKALDRIFILHADHEQNASTSTVRLVGSTGAIALCRDRRRHRRPVGAGAWRRQRGRGQDAGRDRQHRPRPRVHRQGQGQGQPLPADGLRPSGLQELRPARRRAQGERRRGARAARARRTTRSSRSPRSSSGSRSATSTSRKRKLFPNVDFYSGIILEAMGIPTTMFTAIFALARTVGWMAQWNEMIEDPEQKIGRPRQRYTGYPQRATCRSASAERRAQRLHDLGAELGLGGEAAVDHGACRRTSTRPSCCAGR